MGTAQLVDYQTEKPGALLMQVQVHGVARDFCPRVNFQCRLSSLTVSVQPLRAIAYINICVHIKNPQTVAATPLFGHMEILHTLIAMGSTALVVVVPLPR